MDFDQLRQFLAVAKVSNFTRAAQTLSLSQPALSRSIARLEQELGQPVFERRKRGVALTDAGRILESRAKQILRLMEDLKTELRDDGKTGTLRIAAIPTIAPFFLPPILRQFARDFPDAKALVYEDTTNVLLDHLANGEVDLAILALPFETGYLSCETLFTEELLLVLSPENRLAKKKQVTLADLENHPFVLLGETHCLTDHVVDFCHQKGWEPVSVERTSQLASVQELVSLDHGISLVPEMAYALDESSRRVYRSLSGTKPTRDIALVWNPYRYESKLQTAFREGLRKIEPVKNKRG